MGELSRFPNGRAGRVSVRLWSGADAPGARLVRGRAPPRQRFGGQGHGEEHGLPFEPIPQMDTPRGRDRRDEVEPAPAVRPHVRRADLRHEVALGAGQGAKPEGAREGEGRGRKGARGARAPPALAEGALHRDPAPEAGEPGGQGRGRETEAAPQVFPPGSSGRTSIEPDLRPYRAEVRRGEEGQGPCCQEGIAA